MKDSVKVFEYNKKLDKRENEFIVSYNRYLIALTKNKNCGCRSYWNRLNFLKKQIENIRIRVDNYCYDERGNNYRNLNKRWK